MLKELAVPFLLVAVLGSLLLPVPPVLLDFLLVGNLFLALTLLISALYLSDSLKLSSLPGMLLLATLFRLALNVATTRSILGRGEAGRVIEAFGGILIDENLVVGGVIFLVITLIQFIVIAKGAERVAEVAARFTLDALPGKQMSIDADMRAGLIDFETARKRRAEMQTESRFFGALDGAMKFIKGDAIAGLIITGVNIAGGLLTGLFIEGLALDQSLAKYTLLTVGDGMLSQIPALLNALSAGMVVTRVAREDGETLAGELVSQLAQAKRGRILVALSACLLGFMPGMPAIPFVCLGLVFMAGAFVAAREPAGNKPAEFRFRPRIPAVLSIELGPQCLPGAASGGQLIESLQRLRQSIYDQYGLIILLPEIQVNKVLKCSYLIRLHGVTAAQGELTDDSNMEPLLAALEQLMRCHITEFVDDLLTRRTLDEFDKTAPELVSSVVPAIISVTQLTEILKALLSEGVPVRNFDLIMQAIAESGARGLPVNPRGVLADVRVALKRVIEETFAGPDKTVAACVLAPALDLLVARFETGNVPLDYTKLLSIKDFLTRSDPGGAARRVVLTSKAARPLIRDYLALNNIALPVLAHEELSGRTKIEICGQIEAPVEMEDELLETLAA